jgi:hypothetical protein
MLEKVVVSIKKGLFLISHWSIALTIFSLLIITIGFMVWASERGFDITDEGVYLLTAQFPIEVNL